MKRLQALIFDVDGTLADTERDGHRVAFNRAFAEHGLDWRWDVETYGELLEVAGGKERLRHFIEQAHPAIDSPGSLDAFVRELHAAKTRHYLDLLATGGIPLRPGVRRLLQQVRAADLRLAIATTAVPESVTALLAVNLGKESVGWFEVIAAGDIVPRKKPAPDIYRYALERLRLTAASCLAIEDSAAGLRAATAAGVATLVTVNAYTRRQGFTGAMAVLDGLGEPEAPFSVLAGDVGPAHCVDPALLRQLHARKV
jgi:HAD superfamily hydrolase (TIGR01509 family)